MASGAAYTVRSAVWASDEAAIFAVRRSVFVDEQHVDPKLEWDGRDAGCFHVLACDTAGRVIGTGRLLQDGHIGRMAVLPDWRRRGVGGDLLSALIEEARRRNLTAVHLNAQLHATGFYRRAGFRIAGREFMEAGILHCAMRMQLEH